MGVYALAVCVSASGAMVLILAVTVRLIGQFPRHVPDATDLSEWPGRFPAELTRDSDRPHVLIVLPRVPLPGNSEVSARAERLITDIGNCAYVTVVQPTVRAPLPTVRQRERVRILTARQWARIEAAGWRVQRTPAVLVADGSGRVLSAGVVTSLDHMRQVTAKVLKERLWWVELPW